MKVFFSFWAEVRAKRHTFSYVFRMVYFDQSPCFTRGPGVQGTPFPSQGRNFGNRLKLNFLDKIETTGSEWREVTDLLIQLLQPNPKNRPNACQALDMEFFTKHS